MAKVLVVDDNRINLKVAQKCLRKANVVKIESDPLEALKRDDLHTFDVIVLDYQMPKMDGIELKRNMSKMEGVKATFVAWSSFADSSEADVFHDEGFYEFIPKPTDRELLVSIVNDANGAEPCGICNRKIKNSEGRYRIPEGEVAICVSCSPCTSCPTISDCIGVGRKKDCERFYGD
jgi:CheY-like chemotaxis protein